MRSCLRQTCGARAGASTLALAVCALLATTDLAAAQRNARQRHLPAAPASQERQTWVGDLPIQRDRATGQLRTPTRAEAQSLVVFLRGTLDRSGQALTESARTDGIRQIHLQGKFGGVVLARPLADGSVETRCVTSFQEATAFLGLRPETSALPVQ
jgi:hypothetical protein